MPYIVMKRDDIPNATLQVLDLAPNTSQRNLVYDPPGQTKYVNAVENDPVVTEGTLGATILYSYRTSRGLAAWLMSSVNDGTGVAATETLSIAAGNAAPGDTVTVDTSAVGGPVAVFLYVAGAPSTSLEVQVGGDNNASAANLLAATINPANGLLPYVTAAAGAANEVDYTAASEGTAGNGITVATSGANITAPGNLTGGVDAGPLTAAQASSIADQVLVDLVRFGDLTKEAQDADLAAVNAIVSGVVATASLTADQHADMLSILAGRHFVLPARAQIADATGAYAVVPALGSENGPRFIDPSTRATYDSGALLESLGEGELAGLTSPDFTYVEVSGARGEAVVVYNDDGTLLTVP